MNLKHLYTPIQPTVGNRTDGVTYEELLPDSQLQSIIYCYWLLKTTQPLITPFQYRVVSDGCIDIFFDLYSPQESFVMGFCKRHAVFPLHHWFHYVGVRFLPTMFPQLFNINAAELSNRFEALDAVIPETAKFITARFANHFAPDTIKELLDHYFLNLLSKATFNPDSRLYEALYIILKHSGVVNVETGLNTGISPRQLRRLFRFYIGDTAKTFSNVVRFQSILRAKPSTQSLRKSKLFFDAGYYDQAHFIKEFNTFYGTTPAKAFSR